MRRVSSKEKGAIAHKEAMEEAGRLRESVSDQEEQDEAEEHQPKQVGVIFCWNVCTPPLHNLGCQHP